MEPIETELEGRVARLFARRPDLWRFTVRDRSGLPDNLDPTTLAGEFFIFEIGLIATLQAFIFATLTSIYFGEASAGGH